MREHRTTRWRPRTWEVLLLVSLLATLTAEVGFAVGTFGPSPQATSLARTDPTATTAIIQKNTGGDPRPAHRLRGRFRRGEPH